MTLADVTYLDVTEAASASDFEDRGGLWYHHSIPTQVVHHVAVCCAGPLILGVHLYADLQEARSVVLYFLQEIHGLPDDLTWDEWEAIVASGIAPPGVGQTGVWSARVEPAPHDPAD